MKGCPVTLPISIMSIETKTQIGSLSANGASCAFRLDDYHILTGGDEKKVSMWHLPNQQKVAEFLVPGHVEDMALFGSKLIVAYRQEEALAFSLTLNLELDFKTAFV